MRLLRLLIIFCYLCSAPHAEATEAQNNCTELQGVHGENCNGMMQFETSKNCYRGVIRQMSDYGKYQISINHKIDSSWSPVSSVVLDKSQETSSIGGIGSVLIKIMQNSVTCKHDNCVCAFFSESSAKQAQIIGCAKLASRPNPPNYNPVILPLHTVALVQPCSGDSCSKDDRVNWYSRTLSTFDDPKIQLRDSKGQYLTLAPFAEKCGKLKSSAAEYCAVIGENPGVVCAYQGNESEIQAGLAPLLGCLPRPSIKESAQSAQAISILAAYSTFISEDGSRYPGIVPIQINAKLGTEIGWDNEEDAICIGEGKAIGIYKCKTMLIESNALYIPADCDILGNVDKIGKRIGNGKEKCKLKQGITVAYSIVTPEKAHRDFYQTMPQIDEINRYVARPGFLIPFREWFPVLTKQKTQLYMHDEIPLDSRLKNFKAVPIIIPGADANLTSVSIIEDSSYMNCKMYFANQDGDAYWKPAITRQNIYCYCEGLHCKPIDNSSIFNESQSCKCTLCKDFTGNPESAICAGYYTGPETPTRPDRICFQVRKNDWDFVTGDYNKGSALPSLICTSLPSQCPSMDEPVPNAGYAQWPAGVKFGEIGNGKCVGGYINRVRLKISDSQEYSSFLKGNLPEAQKVLQTLHQQADQEERNITEADVSNNTILSFFKEYIECENAAPTGMCIGATFTRVKNGCVKPTGNEYKCGKKTPAMQ